MTGAGDPMFDDEGDVGVRASSSDGTTELSKESADGRDGASLEARLVETAREAEALYRASALLADATNVDRLLEKILDAVDEHFGHPIATIHLKDEASGELRLVGYRGHTPGPDQLINRIDGPGIVARVARAGRPDNVADVAEDAEYVGAIPDTRSELAVPLRIDADVLGIINVESPRVGAFSDSDVRVLTSFAEHAAVAVRTAQLYERLQSQARREVLINDIVRAVHRTTDIDEILKVPCVGLATALNVQRAYVATIDWDEHVARFVHAYSADGSPLFTGVSPLASMPELAERLWRGDVVAVADVFEEPILEGARTTYERHNTRAVVYVPVVTQSDWHAFLLVCSDSVREWTRDEIQIMQTVAEQVGTAFVQAELFDRVVGSKREWERTFDAMSDGVLLVDGARRVYGANSAAAVMLGASREGAIGLGCCDIFGTSSVDQCPVCKALANGVRVLEQCTPPRIGRVTQVTVDPMAGGDKAVVVLRDVSELRRFEENARRQSVVLSQLVSSSDDPIALLDKDGTLMWCNGALASVVGGDAATLVGKSVGEVLAPDARRTAFAELARAREGEPRFFETALTGTGGGQEHWMLATLTPVFDDTLLAGILMIGRDITGHRRAAERAAVADKLRALGQLSSGVAHNFNNALSVILGRAQLLRRKIDDPAILAELAVMEQVAHDASNTVRRIQNFARRRVSESHATIDLKTLLVETLEMTSTRWRSEANARGVRYDVSFEAPDPEYYVLGNESELREVFVNLIFNALDAMPDGGSLTVSLARDGGYTIVRVADTGCGMPEESMHRVFEPFFTTKGIEGTGLGLPVSYGIVSRHEGRIEFEPNGERGTVFSVTLPCKETRDAALRVAQGLPELEPLRTPVTVLVVEDEAEVRDTIERALSDRGHEVVTAPSGAAALDVLGSVAVDIVLTDLSMPDMNGLELIGCIRRRLPGVKVALMTGADFSPILDGDGSEPLDLVLRKPFEIDELCYLVETTVASLAPQQES